MKSPRGQGRGWREKQQLTRARNQQSEFSLCLHKLAPVWLAAGAGHVGGGRPSFPEKQEGSCFTYEGGLMTENHSSCMLMLKRLPC